MPLGSSPPRKAYAVLATPRNAIGQLVALEPTELRNGGKIRCVGVEHRVFEQLLQLTVDQLDCPFVWRQVALIIAQQVAALTDLGILQAGEQLGKQVKRPIQILYRASIRQAGLTAPDGTHQQHQAEVEQRHERKQLALDSTN